MARTARPLVPEAERLAGADLPAKHVVFTFDQGPSATTPELTKYLHAHAIRGVFFVDARYAGHEAALQEMASDGQLLGNRAATNRDLVKEVPLDEVAGELATTDALIRPFVPWNRKFFRAPFGSWTKEPLLDAGGPDADAGDLDAVFHTLEKTALSEYVGPIHWNIDADCSALAAADCASAYLQRVRAKSSGIVRFDDTEQTFEVVKLLVPALEAEGYVFEALDAVPAVSALLATCDATCGACTGPTASECSACPRGARLVQGQCVACTVCRPGSYAAAACAEADTVCTPCAAGTYQPAPGETSCLACGDCSDGDPCTSDACHPITGCTHTKIPSCPATPDAGPPPIEDAGGSRPTTGGRIDDENNIAVSVDESEGCSIARRARSSDGFVAFVVALCIVVRKRRRERNRPLNS